MYIDSHYHGAGSQPRREGGKRGATAWMFDASARVSVIEAG